MSSSLHSSSSDCYAPYSKLSQSSTDTSSLDDCCDPSEVLIIRNKHGKSPSKQKSISKSVMIVNPSINREYDAKVFDILLVAAEHFATQITLMDWPVFKAIMPEELMSCAWNTKSKLDRAYNIVQFIRRFNHTNFWVQKEILHAQSFKSRVEILSKMIKVAKKLLELNNLNGLRAVITALLSAPIYRLESCWNSISRRDRMTFNSLAELVSEEENRRRLRKHLSMTSLPCIPFLGLYLTDLVYIDTLHPFRGGMESSQRKIQMNNICRIMSEFQQSDYGYLQALPHVQSYLLSVRYIEELQKFVEDDNYKISLSIEPAVLSSRCQSNAVSQPLLSKSAIPVSRVEAPPASTSEAVMKGDWTDDRMETHSSGPLTAQQKRILPLRWLPKWPGLSSRRAAVKSELQTDGGGHQKEDVKKGGETKWTEPERVLDGLSEKALVHHVVHEGFVLRKQVMKMYRKPRFCRWKKFWMVFTDQHLLLFKMRSFAVLVSSNAVLSLAAELSSAGARGVARGAGGGEAAVVRRMPSRGLFCSEPHKCYPVTGRCMVVLIEDEATEGMPGAGDAGPQASRSPARQRPKRVGEASGGVFQLNDLNRGNIFKFKTVSLSDASNWCDALQDVIQRSRKALEKNLMIFD